MLPIIIDPAKVTVGLAGEGPLRDRRLSNLRGAGVSPLSVPFDARAVLAKLDILYVAGGDQAQAEALAARARELGVLVNLEDDLRYCDFHVPASVRRGDLLLTVSTAGRSPGLARLVREWLEQRFGVDWEGRAARLARLRDTWRAEGYEPAEIVARTRSVVQEEGWLS